jgi:hypothetical protein
MMGGLMIAARPLPWRSPIGLSGLTKFKRFDLGFTAINRAIDHKVKIMIELKFNKPAV